jgi:hypothetical protein
MEIDNPSTCGMFGVIAYVLPVQVRKQDICISLIFRDPSVGFNFTQGKSESENVGANE